MKIICIKAPKILVPFLKRFAAKEQEGNEDVDT